MVQGAKPCPGSNSAPPECGPGREIMVLGQTLVARNVVRGEKPRVWVKHVPARVWSRERNYGLGSNLGGGKCGPWEQNRALGQTLPRPSVVQGEKLWSWVKPWWREMWSRERNCGPGSSPPPPECGPGSKTAAPGQARPRPSVVQGEKLRPRVKLCPARVWSREQNRAPGQARPRRSMVQGEKLRPRVKPAPARVRSRERNCDPRSSLAPPQHGPGSKTAAPGQARARLSVVQGEKLRPRVKPGPARVWSRERNCDPRSSLAPPQHGSGSKTAAPGQVCGPRSPPAPSPRPRT